MHNFRKLGIWQKSRALVKEVYRLTPTFPDHEKFGLRTQIQRSSISISSNIAEGSGRNSSKDFSRFLDMAISSAFELENEIIISNDLEYISEKELKGIISKVQEIQRMIKGFQKQLSD